MAEYTKFGVREIANVVFKAAVNGTKFCGNTYAKGQPILYFDSLKTSTVEGAGTTVYADGGRGNTHLVSWTGEKTITFTMEDALISPLSLAALSSAKVDSDEGKIVHKTEFKAGSGNSYTITGQASNTKAYYAIVDDDNNLIEAPKEFTSGSTTLANGVTYFLDYYVIEQSPVTVISLTGEDLGINFYVEAETLFRGQDGLDRPAEFIIPKAKIQSNFTFNMAASGDPSTFTFTMDAFPGKTKNNPNKKVLCEINVLDTIYDPDDGIEDLLNLKVSTVGTSSIIEVKNKDAGLTYKYKAAKTSFAGATVGTSTSAASFTGYTDVAFDTEISNLFSFATGDNEYLQVVGIRDGKVEAASAVVGL